MAKTTVKILKKGDSVLSVVDRYIMIRRKNGEVDIYTILLDANNLMRIDIDNVLKIGYGNNEIETISDDNENIKITTF